MPAYSPCFTILTPLPTHGIVAPPHKDTSQPQLQHRPPPATGLPPRWHSHAGGAAGGAAALAGQREAGGSDTGCRGSLVGVVGEGGNRTAWPMPPGGQILYFYQGVLLRNCESCCLIEIELLSLSSSILQLLDLLFVSLLLLLTHDFGGLF
jgi:hypothetical protein